MHPDEINEYAARHGIPTVHEDTSGQGEEDLEVSRLRFDLAAVRGELERLAGAHPDGTCRDDPNSYESRWAARYGCGHPKDPGYLMSRRRYLARAHGLEHPEVAALLAQLAGWESRLPREFEAVREEYLAWHWAEIGQEPWMFRAWQDME